MNRTALPVIIALGAVFNSAGGEPNVVFEKTLRDGCRIEVRETVETEKAGSTSGSAVVLQGGATVQTVPVDRGTIRYEMYRKSDAPESVRIWKLDSAFIGENVDDARCQLLDVIVKGDGVAILYSRHVGVYVDVVDRDGKSQTNSHLLCTTITPRAASTGRLVSFGGNVYALFRTADTERALFLVDADGVCTRMAIQPDTEDRSAIP